MPQEAPHRHHLTHVEPGVVDHPLHEVADDAAAVAPVPLAVGRRHRGDVEGVEPRVAAPGHVAPRAQRLVERRRARGRAGPERAVDVRVRELALAVVQEVLLLLPGEVRDGPADGVEAVGTLDRLLVGHAPDGAGELAAGETELEDQGVRHRAAMMHGVGTWGGCGCSTP